MRRPTLDQLRDLVRRLTYVDDIECVDVYQDGLADMHIAVAWHHAEDDAPLQVDEAIGRDRIHAAGRLARQLVNKHPCPYCGRRMLLYPSTDAETTLSDEWMLDNDPLHDVLCALYKRDDQFRHACQNPRKPNDHDLER